MGTGDQAGTWGATTNTNLGTLIEQAISGYVSFACTGGTDTLGSMTPGATAVPRNMYITLTANGGGTVTVPTNTKLYFIFNNTSSPASAVLVKTVAGTGISVPAGSRYALVCDGTNVVNAVSANGATNSSGANPTAVVGLAAVNGVATTFMRSDASPPLDVTIAPTWTAAHIWSASVTFNGALTSSSTAGFSGVVTFTNTTAPTINDGLGNQYSVGFRGIPQVVKSASYTLVGTDNGKHIYISTGGVIVNASVFNATDVVMVVNNSGSAQTATQGANVTLRLAGTASTGNRTIAQYGMMTLLCVVGGTNPVFHCSGAGVS